MGLQIAVIADDGRDHGPWLSVSLPREPAQSTCLVPLLGRATVEVVVGWAGLPSRGCHAIVLQMLLSTAALLLAG
jgi:hypothetical protein